MQVGSVFFGIGIGIILTIGYQKIKKYVENRQARYIARYYSNNNIYSKAENNFIKDNIQNNKKNNKQNNKKNKTLLNLNNINGSFTESDDNEYTEL